MKFYGIFFNVVDTSSDLSPSLCPSDHPSEPAAPAPLSRRNTARLWIARIPNPVPARPQGDRIQMAGTSYLNKHVLHIKEFDR